MLPTPIKVTLTSDGLRNFTGHLKDRLEAIKADLNDLHTNKLPMWRRMYEARPAEDTKTVPFENASNLVVPIVGIHCDTLKARLLAAIFRVRPIWLAKVQGNFQGRAEAAQNGVQDFLSSIATEPDELDLYRVYGDFVDDVIQYGTGSIKLPWETIMESFMVSAGDGISTPVPRVVYDGPRPEKIMFEDLLISPSDKTIEHAHFKAHRRRLLRYQLEDRAASDIYDKEIVKSILGSPDRTGNSPAQTQSENDSGIKSDKYRAQEWDIYECWTYYGVGNDRVKVIATYHMATNKLLRCVYRFLPDDPFVSARLLTRDGSFFGRGFCEVLGSFQEEDSQIHSQRRDAQTVANAKVWRVDPFSKLHDGYKIFPSAMLPAIKDEIEPMSHGEPSQVNIDEERMTLELAERRSGISPPMQSYGAGSFNKRGVYSAMGTLSLLQEGNNRTDLSVGDIRYFHTKVGRLIANQYAALGLDSDKFAKFGSMADSIKAGLRAIRDKTMSLPITAPSASVNREVEKQSDIMLVGIMSKHYQTVAAMLSAASNAQTPPEVKAYMASAVKASNSLMQLVLKHFDYSDPELYVPEVTSGGAQAGGQPTGQPAVGEQASSPEMVGAAGVAGIPSVGGNGSGLQPEQTPNIQ